MKELAGKFLDSRNAVTGLFLVIAISLMFNTVKVIQRNYELQEKVDNLADEVALIAVQNQNLKYNIEYYKTDAFLQSEAKRRLNLAEPGEKVILLPKDGDVAVADEKVADQQIDNTQPLYRENFDKWMTFLFGGDN